MSSPDPGSPSVDYDLLERQVTALLEGESDFIANAANFSAFIFTELPALNWAGFYFPDPEGLVLGPFGGRPACTRLPAGQGVCGAAYGSGASVVVDDVNAFPGHIACDSASRSEIVIPLMVNGSAAGVFDVDSPVHARFSTVDQAGLERLVYAFVRNTVIPRRYQRPPIASIRLNERIDIQTCRDHHVVIRFLVEELNKPEATAQASFGLLKRLQSVLKAHLKLEDECLYPRLAQSANEVVRRKAERYRREVGGLTEHFTTLWKTWSVDGAIASDGDAWRRDWSLFQRDLTARMNHEDDDLYVAAEADGAVDGD